MPTPDKSKPDDGDPWCEPCKSWHPVPRDVEHWQALHCFAPPPPAKAEPVVHYAPYGRNAIGQFDCGATDGGYTGQPYYATCELCKAKSPGLWPENAAAEPGSATAPPKGA